MNQLSIPLLILVASLSRLIPHPPNVTPIVGISLMSGVLFQNKWAAYLVPLLSLIISDLFIGFHELSLLVYALFLVMTWASRNWVKTLAFTRVMSASLFFSLFFFVVSNLGVWASGLLYARTGTGLLTCFTFALPFLGNSLIGDIGYTALLYFLIKRCVTPFSTKWSRSPVTQIN